MQEIPRALLLPPPSAFPPKAGVRPAHGDVRAGDAEARAAERGGHAPAPTGGQSFITLVEPRREDTVDLKGKQFRFRPYTNRATADAVREADAGVRPSDLTPVDETADSEINVDVLDGFGSGARERNSTPFLASYIAQHRLSEGLHNPKYAAASDAYRRAGGSPTVPDNQPRVVSFSV